MMNVKMPTATDDDDDRVDHRAFDLALERFGSFLELGQALQNDFQRTARLAGLDHVDVQAVEGLGALGHRLGERRARLRSRRRRPSGVFLRRPGLGCWPSRIRRLRRIGRPASCRIESCRVKVVSTLRADAADGEAALLLAALAFSAAAFLRLFLTAIFVTK